ncbi:hypothetical protein RFI_04417 [Reticulomyxa filosa]|uniref:Uncharacterized protein n=1 Tax=Reticulomyxa filosa TaxID=46433 RepID=X6P533_RETFI|nr:hypothetical protein RFI_04417 [Reticulomyxa filosa]|eukprot:ETO32697.1 hypothetical protein RFI_04417 [Reticulomyxa filosa]
MLHLNVKSEEKVGKSNKTFPVSGYFKKEWISLTNKPQKLNALICCIFCPRQYKLKKEQLNEGTKSGKEDLKDHLDKSCNLIPVKQSIPYEITNQLHVMRKQIKELQNVVKSQTVLSFLLE